MRKTVPTLSRILDRFAIGTLATLFIAAIISVSAATGFAQNTNPALGRFNGQLADNDPRVLLVMDGKKAFEEQINASFPGQQVAVPESFIKVVSDLDKFHADFKKKTSIEFDVKEMKVTFMNNMELTTPVVVNVQSKAFVGLFALAQKDPRGQQIAVAAIAAAFRHEFLDHIIQKWTNEVRCHEDELSNFLISIAKIDMGEYQDEAMKYANSLKFVITQLKSEQKAIASK